MSARTVTVRLSDQGVTEARLAELGLVLRRRLRDELHVDSAAAGAATPTVAGS
jgi:hypothetical protein